MRAKLASTSVRTRVIVGLAGLVAIILIAAWITQGMQIGPAIPPALRLGK